jgi:hypothetical protein
MKLSNKEFCKRLRKAKPLAVSYFRKNHASSKYCIHDACARSGLFFNTVRAQENCTFTHPDYRVSSYWVFGHAENVKDIQRVFNESIKALGEKP